MARVTDKTKNSVKSAFNSVKDAVKNSSSSNRSGSGGSSGSSWSGARPVTSSSKVSSKVSWDNNTDYQAKIIDAVSRGDYTSAAQYEQQRNAKIDSLNASGTNKYGATTTNKYSSYLNGGSGSSGGFNASQYVPYDNSGNDYAAMLGMSEVDQAAIAAYKEMYARGQASGDKTLMRIANEGAEAIRANYGYSGGTDGSMYVPLYSNAAPAVPTFEYEEAPSYSSRYADRIETALSDYMTRDPFVYNPETDPLYKSYQSTYAREGGRAMDDALGQIAAQTGGMASSYAGTAAQQTYNNYMQKLADKVPELQQLAYSMYLDEGDTMANQLNMLMNLENQDYNQYLDQLGQYNTDRSFAYNQLQDEISGLRYNNEWNYGVRQDQKAADLAQQQWEYNMSQDQLDRQNTANQQAMDNAWTKLQSGVVPTDAELALLGMSQTEAQQLAQMMKMMLMGYYG